MVERNNGWLESEGEAQREILESRREPSSRTSGRDPAVLRATGKQAPNGSVSGFRGSQKDNGHPPNGGPGGSARRFRSTAPPRPACSPPALGPGPSGARGPVLAARCWPVATGEHLPLLLARPPLFAWPSSLTRSPSPARSQAGTKSKSCPTRKRRHRRFSSKQTLLGRRGSPARPPAPLRDPRAAHPPGPRARPTPPSPAPQAPSHAASGAARTAHRLPKRRLQRRHPALECGPGPGRRVLLLLHREGREPHDSRRRWRRRRRADVTRSGQPARAGAVPSAPIREEPGLSGRGGSGERADRLAEEEEREGEQAS